jgi:hypothetical protein
MPVLGAALAWAIARGALPARAWLVVVCLQAALLGGALVAVKSGQAEEDRVEKVTGHDVIHHHEEAAEAFTWASGVVLAIAAAPLVGRLAGAAGALRVLAVLGALVAGALGIRTGLAGGELVYIHGAASAYAPAKAPAGGAGEATPESPR